MLFVSIQPEKNEQYYSKNFILKMAEAVKLGGAKGLRIESVNNIKYIKKKFDLPIIGLIKKYYLNKERYITPTFKEIDSIAKTNCDYIAIDYTLRDNLYLEGYLEITKHIHNNFKCKIIADISNLQEAKNAYECNVDYISTTLRGYTKYTKEISIPDISFVKELTELGINNIIAEGGYSNHSQYTEALNYGAKIIVIGTAITRPHLIVKKIINGTY